MRSEGNSMRATSRAAVAVTATVVLGLALLVGACGGGSSPGGDRTPGGDRAGAPSSCAGAGATTKWSTRVGAVEDAIDESPRTALLYVPSGLASGARVPALLALHGYGGTPSELLAFSQLRKRADRDGFVVLAPKGVDEQWHFRGYPVGLPQDRQSDLAFLGAMLDRLVALDCVDAGRIVVVGYSMGGGMADFLACRQADRLAGTVLISAEHLARPCRPSRPIPIVSMHAVDDTVLPYHGGDVAGSYLKVVPVERAVADWAAFDGCAGEPRSESLPKGAVRLRWRGCTAPVVHYWLPFGDHDWPGADFPGAVEGTELVGRFITGVPSLE